MMDWVLLLFLKNNTALLHQNDIVNDRINDRLTASGKEIYNYLLKNKTIDNASRFAEELNKSLITIQRGLKRLVELDLIKRVGSNK